MKKKKVIVILVCSVVLMMAIVASTFMVETHSLKLPAVIQSEKVIVSSQIDGILTKYNVTSMQTVEPNQLIAQEVNRKLAFKLQTLMNEKQKYQALITSATSGDYLKTELYRLDEDIQKNQADWETAKQELASAHLKLHEITSRYEAGKRNYEVGKQLCSQGILSNSDLDKLGKEFWEIQSEYSKLKNDSLTAVTNIKSTQNIIRLLQARKNLMSNSETILASKYLIDMDEVEANINDLKEDIRNSNIYAPVAGVVTDLHFQPGEKVDKGDVIAEIADFKKVWIVAYGTSEVRHRVKVGQRVRVLCNGRNKLWGHIQTVSPVMEKVSSLSSSFETVNTYAKFEIKFDDPVTALKLVTPGERIFVRVFL